MKILYALSVRYHKNVQFRRAARLINDWFNIYKLVQLNSIKNIAGNILYLVFTNMY